MVETPGRITLWGIEVFVAVADEKSISAAARRLEASASAMSQQLTNLENAVGAVLLDRSARPLQLTAAGHLFRRRAQSILNEAEQARVELARQDLSSMTRFRLGVIEDFDADVTPRLLTDLAGELGATRFLLETGASHRLHDLLESRALDVVVCADLGTSADWMEVHPLLREPFVAAVPRGHGGALEELRALPLIQYTSRHHMGRQIAGHLAQLNLRLDHRFELDSYHAIMAMVAARQGWTILTPLGFLRAQRFHEAVDLVPLPIAPLTRQISLFARREVLGSLPGDVAARLRPLLSELIVAPSLSRMSWLAEDLRLS